MEFRWVILIALWTFLAGPIFHSPPEACPSAKDEKPPPARRGQFDRKARPRAHVPAKNRPIRLSVAPRT
jgi:hypothetical protein